MNSYLEIDLNIFKNNCLNIINKYNEYEYKIAMVKGNAYGHGIYVINTLIESGFNYLAVSSLEEAINIRKYNKEISILCTEPIDLKYIDKIIENNITLTIHNIDYLKELINLNVKIKVHFKLDTGMNRLGFKTKESLVEAYNLLNTNIELEGVYSHLGTTGIIDDNYDSAVAKFKDMLSALDIKKIKIIHLFSSFSLLSHPKIDICNGFRIGSALFGINTFPIISSSFKDKIRMIRNRYYKKKYNLSEIIYNNDIDLKICMSLHSKVIEIKNVSKGSFVGYGLDYKTKENIKVAIVDIGYKDGIGRINNNRKVIINNKKYEVLGQIEMCMIMVKVDENVHINDKVTLINKDLKINNMCSYKNETVHEVFLSLGSSLPKKYIKNNEVVYTTYFEEKGF